MKVRLLPLLILAASLTLTVKVNGLWQGLHSVLVPSQAEAEEGVGGTEAADAAAEQDGPAEPDPVSAEADATGASEPPDAGGAVQATDPLDLSDEEILLLQQLGERRQAIERRAQEIEQRAALLEAAEQRIDSKVEELKKLQATIEQMLVQHDEQEDSQLNSLVKIYQNMKPKEAARIFEQLDMVVLLEVVDRMSERRVAPILAEMDPSKAKAVTLELAHRRELPLPRE